MISYFRGGAWKISGQKYQKISTHGLWMPQTQNCLIIRLRLNSTFSSIKIISLEHFTLVNYAQCSLSITDLQYLPIIIYKLQHKMLSLLTNWQICDQNRKTFDWIHSRNLCPEMRVAQFLDRAIYRVSGLELCFFSQCSCNKTIRYFDLYWWFL